MIERASGWRRWRRSACSLLALRQPKAQAVQVERAAQSVWWTWLFALPFKSALVLADGEVALIHNVIDNVNAVLQAEIDERRLSVLHLVKRRFLDGGRANVGKTVIVVNG